MLDLVECLEPRLEPRGGLWAHLHCTSIATAWGVRGQVESLREMRQSEELRECGQVAMDEHSKLLASKWAEQGEACGRRVAGGGM